MKLNFLLIRIIVLVLAALLLLLTVYNGLRTWKLLNPSENDSLQSLNIPDLIPEKNISNIRLIPSWHLFKDSAKASDTQRESRLNIRLMGVISSNQDSQARVIMEHPSGEQKYYKKRDEIMPGVVLEAIYADHIVINNRGSGETLPLYNRKNKNLLLKTSVIK